MGQAVQGNQREDAKRSQAAGSMVLRGEGGLASLFQQGLEQGVEDKRWHRIPERDNTGG